MDADYDKKYPYGVQTVVPGTTYRIGYNLYQVNTRTSNGWYVSKPVKHNEVVKTLKEQAEKFKKEYSHNVDIRYVEDWVGSNYE